MVVCEQGGQLLPGDRGQNGKRHCLWLMAEAATKWSVHVGFHMRGRERQSVDILTNPLTLTPPAVKLKPVIDGCILHQPRAIRPQIDCCLPAQTWFLPLGVQYWLRLNWPGTALVAALGITTTEG